jgi:hypothetical protein
MDWFTILAQAVENTAPQAAEQANEIIKVIWETITSLNHLEAMTFISFGLVCLLYGWRIFKMLVVIAFGLFGLVLGMELSNKIIGPVNQQAIGLICMGLLAVLAIPLMRWFVCVLGAVTGGILASAVWYACGLPDNFIWAGALTGIVAGGMMSFIIFRIAVMLFTSLLGSLLLVTGSMALLYMYQGTSSTVQDLVFGKKWFLTVVLSAPMAIGIILQNRLVKNSKDWNI